jgi:hypothetical protein
MINSIYAWLERRSGRTQRERLAALLPRLLVLGVFWLWPLVRAEGQSFLVNPIPDTSVAVGTPLFIQATLNDSNIPPSQVTFALASNRPNTDATNATINSFGAFNWVPAQAFVVNFTVTAISLVSGYQTSANFTVTVTNAGPPAGGVVIDTIPPQTVAEGATLIFTNSAHATDNPTSPLVFRLLNAPSGATIANNTLTSGIFSWTPTSAQAAIPSYTIREVVIEPSTLASNYQDFQVTVTRTNNCAQLDEFLAAIQQGGYFSLSNCTTIVLSNALTIANSVTLDAGPNNVTISGQGGSRLFTVMPGVTNFTLRGLTLSGGRDPNGGSLFISPGAVVTLTNCTLIGNGAVGVGGTSGNDGNSGGTIGKNGGNGTAGAQALGGAIYNLGALTICNSSLYTNGVAGGSGGSGGDGGDGSWQGGNGGNGAAGALGYGGAIYNLGTLALTNCTFSGNTASGGSAGSGGAAGNGPFAGSAGRGAAGASGCGAAIYSAQSVTVVNCTFSGNSAQSGSSSAGGTDVSSGNGVNGPRGSDSLGGGVFSQGSGTFVNCTFYNNTVVAGNGGDGGDAIVAGAHTAGNGGNGGNGTGGGLYNTGAVAVVNCTFSGCGAVGGTNGVAGGGSFTGSDGSPGRGRGGDIAQGSGTFALQNSILGASSAGTNAYDTSASRITDAGFNISSDSSLNLSGTSLKNTDPKLGSLANNGGPTQTIALQTDSPALNRVPTALSPATDQRGVRRPQGAACDIGAYELVTLPAILVQPQSQTIANTNAVTFTVSALGDSLSYQWRFGSAAIPSATNASYTIASATTNNAGTYDVVITNGYGAVTSTPPATLTIVFPPAITAQPTNLTVPFNGDAHFTVVATGDPPLAYQWQFGGTNLTDSARIVGSRTNFMTISNVLVSDQGNYSVVVMNASGSVTSAPAVLIVGVSPSITTQPASQTVVLSSNATFRVTALGTAPLTYQWRFNGTNISGATSSDETITSVRTNDAGNYDVIVTNSFGVTTSRTAKLTVTVPLPFTISGRITNGADGLGGVKVMVSGVTNSGMTDFNGYYTISSLPANNYTVTPLLACFIFSPSNQVVHVGPNNTNGVNFSTSNDFHLISGRVIEYTNGLSGVTVTITGGGETNSVTTDTNGNYTFSGLCSNTYSVSPSLRCYRFNPPSQSLQLGSDTNNVDFIAGRLAYTISGSISNGGAGLSGVMVTVADLNSTNTVISTNGNYSASGLCPSTYSVTPSLAGFAFDPPVLTKITVGPDATTANFVAVTVFSIGGRVTEGANGVSGVSVTAGTNNVVTDPNGYYTISGLRAGPIIITPSLDCYRFNPANVAFTVSSNTAGVNFSAIHGFAIRGLITVGSNGLSGVTVSAGGKSTVTTNGNYALSGLCSSTYTVTPLLSGYQFEPGTANVTLSSSDSNGVNFAAIAVFNISGQILEGTNGLGGVNLGIGTNTTGPDGRYTISGLRAGPIIITPSLDCYRFAPTNLAFAVSSNTTAMNFNATNGFAIRGLITVGGNGLSGVTVSAGGKSTVTTNGNYALSGLCSNTYTVTPSLSGYQFEPGTANVTLSSSDSNGVNFAAVAVFSISGQILEGTNGLGGVNLGIGTNTTGTNGSYTISGLRAGTNIIAPSLGCYHFNPTNRVVIVGPSANNQNFAASRSLYSISGQITEGGRPMSGVAVQIGDTTIGTDVNGYYALSGLCPDTYSVIPSFPGYQFEPGTINVTLSSTNSNGVNFAAIAVFTISGRVLEGTNGLGGVYVTITNSVSTNIIPPVPTAADGSYAFPSMRAGSVSVNPHLAGYSFQPLFLTVTLGEDTSLPAFKAFPLLNINMTNAAAQLSAAESPGRTYHLQASTDLTNWTTIFTTSNVSTNTAHFWFTDPSPTHIPVRFYRLAENVVVSPVFTMTLTNNAAQFSFVAFPGLTYQVETSANLHDQMQDWTTLLTTNNSSTNIALFRFTDSPTSNRVRFYRLSQTPGF